MRKTVIYTFIILVCLIFLGWYFSQIFVYLIISLVIATILRPLVNYLHNTQIYNVNIPRSIAILISFTLFVSLILSFVSIFIPLIKDQIEVISNINFNNIWQWIGVPVSRMEDWLIAHGLASYERGTLLKKMQDGFMNTVRGTNAWELGAIMQGIFTVAGGFFIGIISVIFITFFFLYEKGLIRKFILTMVPNAYFEVVITVLSKIEKLLTNYLVGLLFQSLAIFTLSSIGLSILGMKYAITIAAFAAIANVVPYLGPLLGGLFAVIIALSTANYHEANEYIIMIVKIFAVFAIVKVNDDIVVQPMIFSKSVKAHPLEIFIIIFVGATVGGIFGMIAAIPVYTIVRVSAYELMNGFRQYHIFKAKN